MGDKVKKIFLKAYFCDNFGDDLFVQILCDKYKDIEFHSFGYKEIKDKPNNLMIHRWPILFRIIHKFEKIILRKNRNVYEDIILKSNKFDYHLHVIGSGFMQKNKGSYDYNESYEKYFYNKNSAIIGCNFGPYFDEEFREHYNELFSKLDIISFRDKKSYDLFPELHNKQYAPDIVFGLKVQSRIKKRKSVLFSVINLSAGHYSDREQYASSYINQCSDLVYQLTLQGYSVTLLSLCEHEGDLEVAKAIRASIKKDISILSYGSNSMKEVMQAFSESEFVIASRYHSFIIGLLNQCKVLAISYNPKVMDTYNSINCDGIIYTLDEFIDIKAQSFIEDLSQIPITLFDKECIELSQKHFNCIEKLVENSPLDC